MTRPFVVRTFAIATLLTGALFVSGCTAAEETTAEPSTDTTPSESSSEPTATVTPEPTEPVDPTCTTILPESTVADFESLGWSAREDIMRVGSLKLTGSVLCTWGDFSVATDHVQIFGWAPATGAEASEVRTELIAQGWIVVDDDSGDYVTESADTAIATDDDGFGMTYLFEDDGIKLADTKQGLLLIEWPPA
ncbi:hypothetical protein FHX49_000250 [Microbacterium endophyticum]|uniref:Uncharacterized protein n=1 Tax=Microbacterium endophyticum TaxID=1526412 RepID=A0A7W4YLQ5_9MICO|nr:hypothetical protein [Microbacterium endophyticum]MBB2974709.1 hypothetical protein [Microbacterium endophyticum]NIK37006.1 hypothetical protein [Microbacterium endophyticum]